MAYDVLREEMPNRASREYLQILELAARENEDMVDMPFELYWRRSRRSPCRQ